MALFPLWSKAMSRLDIYVCTKSKCTAKRVQVKLRTADDEAGSYNGPELLSAIRELVSGRQLEPFVSVHEAMCMSGCPVGPRVDMCVGSRRVMYFHRQKPTGRDDLITWMSVASIEDAMKSYLTDKEEENGHCEER
jgi:predicted metal-binding protein